MMTERMTDERRGHLGEFPGKWCTSQQEEVNAELTRARRVEQEQAEKIRRLEEMLRLTNDKMAEQVRQARREVAFEGLSYKSDAATNAYLEDVMNANAPKD